MKKDDELFDMLADLIRPVIPQTEDLSFGIDIRGDEALFIDASHINGMDIDEAAQEAARGKGPVFFRMLENGSQVHTHGFIEDGKIVQYG